MNRCTSGFKIAVTVNVALLHFDERFYLPQIQIAMALLLASYALLGNGLFCIVVAYSCLLKNLLSITPVQLTIIEMGLQ